MALVDSHCHLQTGDFADDRDQVMERARAAGVTSIVVPALDADSVEQAIELSRLHLDVVVAAGIHPGSLESASDDEWRRITVSTDEPSVVAIGETGLDYRYPGRDPAEQRSWFSRHLELASDLNLPVIVHNRDADEDVLSAIADWRADDDRRTAVLHCFVGGPDLAARALEIGCVLGFGGTVTFKSATACHESARTVPLDRMLLETDSPYLAPVPHRGKRNEPANVARVAARIAELRGTTIELIEAATTETAERVFRLTRRALAAGAMGNEA